MRRFKRIVGMQMHCLKRDGDPEEFDSRTFWTWNKVAMGLTHAVRVLE